mgnify:CR=1 FL=1
MSIYCQMRNCKNTATIKLKSGGFCCNSCVNEGHWDINYILAQKEIKHFVSIYCKGERCRICHLDATHKIEETFFDDEPVQVKNNFPMNKHPLTAYVCCDCFIMIMGREIISFE